MSFLITLRAHDANILGRQLIRELQGKTRPTYYVLAYAVRQRTQEIGIRMALGATATAVRMAVLRQASLVLVTGLLGGIAGALLFGRWLMSLTFEISPWDPRILLSAMLLLTSTGLLAAWLPARRASRIAPRIAMQEHS